MCNKQTSIFHSSTESEIISLDTGLRFDGLLALELWDLIFLFLEMLLMFQNDQGNLMARLTNVKKSQKKIDVFKKKKKH